MDGNKSFNITIKLQTLVAGVNGTDVLTVTNASCSDPFFGAQFGVVPGAQSVATLPNPIQNVSTQAGMGIQIFFPGGANARHLE